MNMMTSLDNIPLKTSSTIQPNDDSEDPVVKDILNEFNQEINNQSSSTQYPSPPSQTIFTTPPKDEYVINNCQRNPIPQLQSQKKIKSLYNEDFLRKTFIIIIVIALIFSPIIYNSIIDKLPNPFASIFNTYEFYIKLFFVFIVIYLLMIKNLI